MSRSLRYRNPIICEHLASQYVAGMLTERVRLRLEELLLNVPELDRTVAQWADSFVELHEHVESPDVDFKNSNTVWKRIDQQISDIKSEPNKTETSFFERLFVWQISTAVGAIASLLMGFIIVTSELSSPENPSQLVTTTGPDYLANMMIHDDSNKAIQFVISAYVKNEQQPSRLFVQWPKNLPKSSVSHASLHLWAEDKDTGKLQYIGVQPETGQWSLTKSTWMAITKSSRLLMTSGQQVTDDNIVFSGECLQLKSWKTKAV